MSCSERIMITVALTVIIVITADALWVMDPRSFFFNTCHVKGGLWVCTFSWREFAAGIMLLGFGYMQWIILINMDRLRNPRGEHDGRNR